MTTILIRAFPVKRRLVTGEETDAIEWENVFDPKGSRIKSHHHRPSSSPRPPFFNRGSQRGGRSRGESLYLREKVPETAINYWLISHNYRPSQTSGMPERLSDSACRYAKRFLLAGPATCEKSWPSRKIVSSPNYDSRDNKRK